MIVSADDIEADTVLESTVAIVGSGAAGIPLALELADQAIDVLLIEAGKEPLNEDDQSLYAGDVAAGSLHPPADKYRQRCLGGSTGTWGGRCVPFDRIDFRERDYLPNSGWPIDYEEVARYYPSASRWLEAGSNEYNVSEAFGDSLLPLIKGFDSEQISTTGLERFSRPTAMFERYRYRFLAGQNPKLVYGANCTLISLDEDGSHVRQLKLKTLNGKQLIVKARHYVLAAGGIENARLLLASRNVKPSGVGNDHDIVGRYYMCHIAGNVGQLRFNGQPSDVRHGYEISADGVYCRRRISLTELEQMDQRANNVVMRLHFPRISNPIHRSGVLSLIYLVKPFISYEYATRLRDGTKDNFSTLVKHAKNVILSPLETTRFLTMWLKKRILAARKFPSIILQNKTNVFSLEINAEQAPIKSSRISLSDDLDQLGMPKVNIDWQYSQQDIDSVRSTLNTLSKELQNTGVGSLDYDEDALEADLLRFGAYGGHHIGTTRMGSDPKYSVVNENCRLHDVDNLFITGSSVFPTSSQANPTLTIAALAVRLADYIAQLGPRNE